MYINNVTVFRLRNFFKTLFNHRAIISYLERKVEYTENNAKDIMNLMWKEKVKVVISDMQKSFGYMVMVTDGERHGYIKSESKIPAKFYIENIIAMIRDAKAKRGKDVKTYTKRQTDNKEK